MFKLNKEKAFRRYALATAILLAFGVTFYLFYSDVKKNTIRDFNNEQLLLAKTASKGISSYLKNYQDNLLFIAKNKDVIDFSAGGRETLKNFYEVHQGIIKAITRVDAQGVIIHTYPLNASAIGSDISDQAHIKQIMATHQPVISDVFKSVQGYYAIAIHVPVLREGIFEGSLAILIPIDALGEIFLDNIGLSKKGHAWLITENQTEIYCTVLGHKGKSIFETTQDDFNTRALMEMVEREACGTGRSIHQDLSRLDKDERSEMYTVFQRAELGNSYWTILISYQESVVYLAISKFRNRLIIILLVFFIAVAFYIFSWVKVQNILKEEEKRKQAEKQLKASEEKFKTLFISAGDASLVIKNDEIIDCNTRATKLFDAPKSQIIGDRVWANSPDKQPDGVNSKEKARALVEATLKQNIIQFEWQHKRYTGEVIDVEITFSLIDKKERLFFAILRDITEKKKIRLELDSHLLNLEKIVETRTKDLVTLNLELDEKNKELNKAFSALKSTQSQLLQSEKMASLGVLTAGVAHEINNPLQYLMGANYGLVNYFKENNNTKKDINLFLKSIDTGIKRISGIVQGLNQLSRDNKNFDEECNIHSIIDNSLEILQSQFKHKVVIEKNYHAEVILVKGNVGKLHQVFINLITNAIQAIEKNGVINITTEIVENKTRIEIKDDGAGIDKKHLSQIMDPFFTTKAPGSGTGLGLSITYAIIKEHKGEINIESEIGYGTKAIILLPLMQ